MTKSTILYSSSTTPRIMKVCSKDYEFSRRTMEEHWKAGYNDAVRTLRHPEVLQRPDGVDGVFTFDLATQDRGATG